MEDQGPTSLADCSTAVVSALHHLQEAHAAAQRTARQLQKEKSAIKADARRMAEHLFRELEGSQQQVAQLTAEVEQLRELQSELAEAAAAEAEQCRSALQAAKATEAEALRRAAAVEQELQHARQAAHQLEIEQQDSRARGAVEQEGLASQIGQLTGQLAAAQASTVAKQQVAELWQRKHQGLETQVLELQSQLHAERVAREELQATLLECQQQAQRSQAEAGAFRQAAASTLQDLSELCSALKTAHSAMAADSSSNPVYLRALSLIEASLQGVAAASEGALSTVAASAGGDGSSGVVAVPDAAARGGLVGAQLQQQVHSLLCEDVMVAACGGGGGVLQAAGGMLLARAAQLQPGQEIALQLPETTASALPGGSLMDGMGGSPPDPHSSPCKATGAPHVAPSPPTAAQQQIEGPGFGAGLKSSSSQQLGQDAELAPQGPAVGSQQQQQQQQCSPSDAVAAKTVNAPGSGVDKRAQHSADAGSTTQASAFIQAFRARHARGAAQPLAGARQARGSEVAPSLQEGLHMAEAAQGSSVPLDKPAVSRGAQAPPAEGQGDPSGASQPHQPLKASRNGSGAVVPLSAPSAPGGGRLGQPPAGRWQAGIGGGPVGGAASTRDSLTAVIMAVEDELATLDLRHAALLKQSSRLKVAKALPGDITLELQREEVAGVMRSVREAMQRKGEQLRQLKVYRDQLAAL